MTTQLVLADRAPAGACRRLASLLFGPPLPARLPGRVQRASEEEQHGSEMLVSVLQLLVVAPFTVLYTLAPMASRPTCRSSRCR